MSFTVFGMLSVNWVEMKIQQTTRQGFAMLFLSVFFCILTTASNRESIGLTQRGKYLARKETISFELSAISF